MKNNKEDIRNVLILVLVLILTISIIFLVRLNSKSEINYTLSQDKWTNSDITITLEKDDNELYSFNNGEFTDNNQYVVSDNGTVNVKVNYNGKIKEFNIDITYVDKELPVVTEVKKDNNIYEVIANDDLSGISDYIFVINGVEYHSNDGKYEITEFESLEIKVVDVAGNVLVVDKKYYQGKSDGLMIIQSPDTFTNQSVVLTIVKREGDVAYSFSDSKETDNFQDNNVLKVDENKTVFIKVKNENGIEEVEYKVTNIDKEKPALEIKKEWVGNKLRIIAVAKDNNSTNLLYKFNKEDYNNKNDRIVSSNQNGYTIIVKDEAGNTKQVVINITEFNNNTNQSNNENELENNNQNNNSTDTNNSSSSVVDNSNQNNNQQTTEDTSIVVEYDKTERTTPVTLTVKTNSNNLISFANQEWSANNKVTINENVNNYSIRIKTPKGTIAEKKINITNIITLKEQNKRIIQNIHDKYGFWISYNSDDDYDWYGGQPCKKLESEEKANKALNSLIPTLNQFPPNFFKKFQGQNGYRIVLYDDIPGDVAGLASYEFGDDNKMLLDVNTGFFGRVFYHETWHIMERLLYMKNGWSNPFTRWNSYNPSGFSYGSGNNDYTIFNNVNNVPSEVAFASAYGKTSPGEDRAEIFADLMFRPYKHTYMNSGYAINEKAKYLVEIIKTVWNDSNTNWERWISY